MVGFTVASESPTGVPCPNDVVCLLEVIFIITVTALILLFSASHLGVLFLTPSFRNSHGVLLISLSFADLGVGAVAALSVYPSAGPRGPSAAAAAAGARWPYGDVVCQLATYANLVFLANSGFALTLLGFERYAAVVHPLRYARLVTRRRAALAAGAGWVLAAAVLAPTFAGYPGHRYIEDIYACMPGIMTEGSAYTLIGLFALALPNLIFISATSLRVKKKLEAHARRRAAMTAQIPPAAASGDSVRGTSRRSIQLFKMVRIMTVAVYLSWLPFLVVAVLVGFFGVDVPQVVTFASYWLLIANSLVNGVVYFVLNSAFRDRVAELMGRLPGARCERLGEALDRAVCGRRSASPGPGRAASYAVSSAGSEADPPANAAQIDAPRNASMHLATAGESSSTAHENGVTNRDFTL